MIAIDVERCTGCGACVEVCPTGSLYLVDGKVVVDATRCRDSRDCLDACPAGAIRLAETTVGVPALRPEPEAIQLRTKTAPVPFRSRVLPLIGSALIWADREIMPWLADVLLDTLDRETTRPQAGRGARRRATPASQTKAGRRRHRHRGRGAGN